MIRRLPHKTWWLSICIMLLNIQGCVMPMTHDPEDVLTRSISGLSGKDQFLFRGLAEIRTGERQVLTKQLRFDGEVRQHKGVSMRMSRVQDEVPTTPQRWNPLRVLEEIRLARKHVSRWEEGKTTLLAQSVEWGANTAKGEQKPTFSTDQTLPYFVQLHEEDAKRIFKQRILDEYDSLIIPHQKVNQVKKKLTPTQITALEGKLNGAAQDYRKQLLSMLHSSQVSAEYIIWIDRRSQLPLRLEGVMQAHYQDAGKLAAETIRTVAEFSQYR
ncbi:hypothetical protein MH117_09355 [Paenibacillus sp. ACRRX]|uniref:hypothetical protein n=1 Tax=unclassified Paenibacillus TaxID=185978 RepID=UPI001EF6DA5B|nr:MULTISPECIES: hypothetical protein [unclassified Paenibacillus]MCG7407630.1 hypothetical protein [Paenibacillus sp. ACRRX]MDK8180865.1 hypothetical protein [Paenibacillus sp. UMB4589-SE434]